MAYSKIIYGGNVLIDLTGDTVDADKLLSGATAHDKAGNVVIGALTFATVYTGSGVPDASLGADGDIYLDMGRSV